MYDSVLVQSKGIIYNKAKKIQTGRALTAWCTYSFEYVVIFMLFIAQMSHVIRLPWQQQKPPLQHLCTSTIQVIPG